MSAHHTDAPTAQEDCRDAFRLVCSMESPLETVRAILAALAMMAETMEEDEGTPVQRLAWLARDQIASVEAVRGDLFKMLHTDRDHFQSAGWPGEEQSSKLAS